MAVKKGDRLVYTGEYDPEVVAAGVEYPPGTVVGFRNNRFHGRCAIVLLDKEEGEAEDSFADWPLTEVAPAPI